jgi:flavodoxin
MKFVIVYWTRHGNNKRIVDYIKEKLISRGEVQVFLTEDADPTALPPADFYVFSAAAEAFRIQKNMRKFMKKIKGLEGKKFGIINTHAMENKNWLDSMEKMLNKKNMVKVAAIDFRMEGKVEGGQGLQEGWEAKLDAFMNKLVAG